MDTLFLGGELRQALHISSIITQPCLVHNLATLCLLSFVICYILRSVGMNGYWTPKMRHGHKCHKTVDKELHTEMFNSK